MRALSHQASDFNPKAQQNWPAFRYRTTLAVTLALIIFTSCSRAKNTDSVSDGANVGAPAAAANVVNAATAPADTAAPPQFNGERAMQYVKEVVAFGPRPVNSAAHAKLESYLRTHLKADSLEEDVFTANTPAGPIKMRNFIAKFPGARDDIIVVAGHYDTLYSRSDFVGANDGGSSTGLLLELANELHDEAVQRARRLESRERKRDGYSIWLVWFDGEEALQQWSDTDSLYGSRHLAEKWQADSTLPKIKAFLLTDMIGDADLNIEHDTDSTAWLEKLIYQAATRLGYQSHFYQRTVSMDDDHIPFVKRGVPAADLIDFDYGYDNAFWHTREDTPDKLSPKSLEITGSVILETIRLLNQQ